MLRGLKSRTTMNRARRGPEWTSLESSSSLQRKEDRARSPHGGTEPAMSPREGSWMGKKSASLPFLLWDLSLPVSTAPGCHLQLSPFKITLGKDRRRIIMRTFLPEFCHPKLRDAL